MADKDELLSRLEEIKGQSLIVTQSLNQLIRDVTAQEPPEPEPAPEPEPDPKSGYLPGVLPKAKREVPVTSVPDLMRKLGHGEPGDHFKLAPGSYPGFVCAVNGTQQYPICIVGSDDVVITDTVKLSGNWAGVYGSRFVGNGRKVDICGTAGRVSRCLFDGVQQDGIVYFTGPAHPRATVDFCSFKKIKGAAIRSEIQSVQKHQLMYVGYNHVDGHMVSGDNESVMLVLTDAYDNSRMVYEYNLFNDCLKGYESIGQRELLSCKTAGTVIRGNTIIASRGGYISLRETRYSTVVGNWLRDGSYIKVHGDDHVIQNNNGTGLCIELNAGDATFDNPVPSQCINFPKAGQTPIVFVNGKCKTAHVATRRAVLSDNIGGIKLGVGYPDDKFKCVGIILANNAEAAQRVNGSFVEVEESGVGRNVTTAFELKPAMVGWKGVGIPVRD